MKPAESTENSLRVPVTLDLSQKCGEGGEDRDLTRAALCFLSRSWMTLCDHMDCNLPGSSVHGDSPGENTGVGCLLPGNKQGSD